MDCDKFEATMLDELYGELDELTVAASKRHVGGCARCAALIGGLRATRKIVTLPVLAPSEGFESRLLAAVDAAQAKPKLGTGRVISLAGRWAMRPQTAMAAVFLLMLGTSSVLLSSRVTRSSLGRASSGFTVTENGAPASPSPSVAAIGDESSIDSRTAAAAHGAAPLANASAAPPAAPAPEPLAAFANGPSDREGASVERTDIYSSKPRMAPAKSAGRALGAFGSNGLGSVSGGGGGSADFKKASPSASSLDRIGGDAPKQDSLGGSFAQAPPQAMAHEAARGTTPGAPPPAAGPSPPPPPPAAKDKDDDLLTTARAMRDGAGGCQAAVGEYDRVAGRSFGSNVGYDATLEGARCYASLGLLEAARSRYQRLLTVPAYASRAQTGINAISQVATRARAAAPRPGTTSATPATPAVSASAATPPAAAAPEPAAPPSQK